MEHRVRRETVYAEGVVRFAGSCTGPVSPAEAGLSWGAFPEKTP